MYRLWIESTSSDLCMTVTAWQDGGMAAEAIFHALAAPKRQQILQLVRDEPRSVGEIAASCGASQQAVSHHLQVLKEAGLVDVQAQGRQRLYVVNPDAFESVGSFVAELWPNGLDRLRKIFDEADPA